MIDKSAVVFRLILRMLTKVDIETFSQLYREEYGIVLDDEVAAEKAAQLLGLITLLAAADN